MDSFYWIVEYGKVFCGYLFLMFLWPSGVFYRHLKDKNIEYRFGFCVTVPIVVINSVVLLSGLFHILNGSVICLFFYGTFAGSFVKNMVTCSIRELRHSRIEQYPDVKTIRGKYHWIVVLGAFVVMYLFYIGKRILFLIDAYKEKAEICDPKKSFVDRLGSLCRRTVYFVKDHLLLLGVLIYGMAYFSYGAFQVPSYGYGDLYVHHEWIYGLIEGKIFAGGVYPEAMHCFIYCMNVLFGIRIYSCLLFLQGIHAAAFLVSVYLLLRWVFRFRHTPVFVLMLFLTLDLSNADLIHSMFRLQITMPMEFGLHTVCLGAGYLTRYFRHQCDAAQGEKTSKYCWDGNLFLFMMAAAAAIATHFHVVIMGIIVCVVFAVFTSWNRFTRKYLIPLLLSGFCACLISTLPMAGAMMQGIVFNHSINWAVASMSGDESRELREGMTNENTDREEEESSDIQLKGFADTLEILPQIYHEGYAALYGEERGRFFFLMTAAVFEFCFWIRKSARFKKGIVMYSHYMPVIVTSIVYVVVYAAPMIGLPDIIPEGRFFAPGHMMLLAVMVIPADIIFSELVRFWTEPVVRWLSFVSAAGIYGSAVIFGGFRGCLFYELTRYNAAVNVTNSIIDSYAPCSYTIVSPTDELYQVIQYGWHEELLTFSEKCKEEGYTIPTEYVFVYVEKKPLLYAQSFFFTGSPWIGEEKYAQPYWKTYSLKYPDSDMSISPEIKASVISKEAAKQDIPQYDNPWLAYSNLDCRTILESKIYDWCIKFSEQNPSVLNVYYEDDDFVCYYFRQNGNTGLYDLGINGK